MSNESKTAVLTFTAPQTPANARRIQNQWKGGMSVMGWAKGSGVAAGAVINVYGSSDPGTPVGTGSMGDGNWGRTDDVTKRVLVVSVHPTTGSLGASGVADATNASNVICFWDYLFVEVQTFEGTTQTIEVTLSGADAPGM